jgi:hypothetical protein
MDILFGGYNSKEELFNEFRKYFDFLNKEIPSYFTVKLINEELSKIMCNIELNSNNKFELDIYDSNRIYIYSLAIKYKKLINDDSLKDDYFGKTNQELFNTLIKYVNKDNKS